MIEINDIYFVKSSSELKQCPNTKLPEYAFIGRSNVGKSSLINMLSQRKSLAKISSTPGKTQLINHFKVNKEWFIVDLPGYGYAKTGKKNRVKFAQFTKEYLLERKNLSCVFSLVDSRHKPQASDMEFFEFLGTNGIPFVIVFTKTDKLGVNKLRDNINNYKKVLLESWEELPTLFLTSSEKGNGREEILEFIEKTNIVFTQSKA